MEESIARVYRFKKVLKYSILSLVIAIVGLIVFDYFRIKPYNVYFTNITSNSITVSWNTKMKTDATAVYVDSNSKLPFLILPIFKDRFFDTRDITKAELEATQQSIQNQEGLEVTMNDIVTKVSILDRGKYYTHHIEIKGLEPEKEYSFMVGDSIIFRKVKDIDNNTVAKTYAVPESILTPYPAYGAVRDAMGYDEVPLEELPIVNDGIVYFSYFDKVTGESSNLFSSPLNEVGNWYMDVANAIDKEGSIFRTKYSGDEEGLLADIMLNLGEKGIWTKQDNAAIISPTETFVINIPKIESNNLSPNTESKKVNFFESFVKNAYAKLIIDECTQDIDCDDGKRCIDGSCVGNTTCSGTKPFSYNGTCVQCINDSHCSSTKECNNNHECVDKSTPPPNDDDEEEEKKGYTYECAFITWCSCKIVEKPGGRNTGKDCSGKELETCNKKFEERLCDGHLPEQENRTCDSYTGGAPIEFGGGQFRDGKCMVCGYRGSGSARYVGWVSADENKWDLTTCKKKSETPKTEIKAVCGTKSKIIPSDVLTLDKLTGSYCLSSNKTKDAAILSQSDNIVTWKWECTSSTGDVKECVGTLFKSGTELELKNISNNEICNNFTGCKCLETNKNIVRGEYCSDGVYKYPKSSERCTDADGCKGCEERETVEINNTCTIPSVPEDIPKEGSHCTNEAYNTILQKCDNNNCYYCKDGNWIKLDSPQYGKNCYNFVNKGNTYCEHEKYYCVKNNLLYKCYYAFNIWQLVDSNKRIAGDVRYLDPGEKCNAGESCTCIGGIDDGKKFVEQNKPKYCRETNDQCDISKKGKICDQSGRKCQLGSELNKNLINGEGRYSEDAWYCAPSRTKTSVLNKNIKISVYGEEKKNTTKYIIDQATGFISGLESGSYSFQNNGQTYYFDISEESLKVDNGNILVYIDKNESGEYDEGIDTKISTLGAQIEITTIQKNYKYSLKEGFNFVSFPFVVAYDEYRTAASLLKQLNSVYGDVIYSISKYDGSWKVVGQNVELYSNNDFQLVPGQGYVIKTKEDVEIVIPGKPVKYESETDTAPVTLLPGWNLIGIYGSNVKKYTAKSMLQDINKYETVDFTANNVSSWETDVQRYQGFQLETENGVEMEYGFDYTIDLLKSYFVRVENGSGNWQPELAK